MTLPLLSLCLAVTAPEASGRAYQHVVQQFEAVGRKAPALDPRLSAAAEALARNAVRTSVTEAADLRVVTEEVSWADAYDPSPKLMMVRGHPLSAALESLLGRKDLDDEPASHVGVAAVDGKTHAAIVLVFAERKARLAPFPRRVKRVGTREQLCGELLPPLLTAEIYVTHPDGKVAKVPLTKAQGPAFCAPVLFRSPGRYTLEVIGRGERGPEVAALFFTDAGPAAQAGKAEAAAAEPTTAAEARALILQRINALRAAHGAGPVSPDDRLTQIAQRYSDDMVAGGFFSHVAPDGTDLKARLSTGGYPHRLAGENLGLAGGPLSAHFGIEQSPGHRRNLLEGAYTAAGIGVAFQTTPDGAKVVVTEILADPGKPITDPVEDTYRALATRRAALKLPALQRNPVLERIALLHVKRALELDTPKSELPGAATLHDQVFKALSDVSSAAVDVFIGETPAALPDSQNIADKRNSRIGVGAVRGDSPTFGKGKYWMVVIYTSPAQ